MGVAIRRCLPKKRTSAQRMSPLPRLHRWRSRLISRRKVPCLCTPRRARALRRRGRECSRARHRTSHPHRRRNRGRRTPDRRVDRTSRVRRCPCAKCLLLQRTAFLAGPFRRWGTWLRHIQRLLRSCAVIRNRTRWSRSRRTRDWALHIQNVHTTQARETTRPQCSCRARLRTSCALHRRHSSWRRCRTQVQRSRSATRRTWRRPNTHRKVLRSRRRSTGWSRRALGRMRGCRTHRRRARRACSARRFQHRQRRRRARKVRCRVTWSKDIPQGAIGGEPRATRCDEANACFRFHHLCKADVHLHEPRCRTCQYAHGSI